MTAINSCDWLDVYRHYHQLPYFNFVLKRKIVLLNHQIVKNTSDKIFINKNMKILQMCSTRKI